ncbi:lipoprotein-releasing ABC transporter ATP-binding protein LolD [Psychrobium sp. 1_MG-2023]|uniref:lipoprotein-releasing ABC transporter ATP-binding protein LolD n=1 Tax=Psychrobium sp. 1_MG-2023 TaxID=3062624 RepID=UPI000C3298E1|nr:lipoprotein-releasing ABC transporter ATP-binding protein LolD [Psychrobium sp. 1_MG-2023]MDP2560286.1 lipoprotein-releasing ABC transporter ATP-binding protein LolD [Psychrobium sp. 1_MG-2023]PKF55403.1 lipoprotein-releasing system ATP-binding protein LolD [Alteromonadales bacterium alter-6D02]
MNNKLLTCQGIVKTYQDGDNSINVLNKLDLSLSSHELLAITGSSGSGKSTLLHILGTLDKPTKGNVLFNGQDIHQLSATKQAQFRNEKLGFIYQFHHLLAEFSALENVMMPLLIAGVSEKKAKQQALAMIEQVGLKDRANHQPSMLSGGERQRIAISRALVNRPALVLADEPTGNLDSENAHTIFELLKQLRDSQGTSFVVVTHDQMLARRLDRVVNLSAGVLKADSAEATNNSNAKVV